MRPSRRRPPGGRLVMIGLVMLAGAILTAMMIGAAIAAFGIEPVARLWPALSIGAGVLVFLALLTLGVRLVRLYDGIDRLRGDLIQLSQGRFRTGRGGDARGDADVALAADLIADLGDLIADRDKRVASRLESVLAGLGDAIVVATDSGLVTLVNAPARHLLGAERVAVGTSLYAALNAEDSTAAARRAAEEAMPVRVELSTVDGRTLSARVNRLRGHGGTLYSFSADGENRTGALDHALTLHDVAPAPVPPTDSTPLGELPVLLLDLETTGLDVDSDSVVAIGCVCALGDRIFRGSAIDLLVNPERPIPPRSTRIHGITDAMVAAAPPFADAWPRLAELMADRIVIGHHIAFDMAVLRATTAREEIAWTPPVTLDVAHLASALDPRGGTPALDELGERYGVEIVGRHTALGDALTAAAIWQRLLPRLADRAITTLSEARAFAATAHTAARLERQAGWHKRART